MKGSHYIVKKFPLKLIDQVMGFCFMFHSENQLREMEMNLSSQSAACGLTAKYHFQDIVHASPVMEEVISIAKKVADTDYTVLIQGESGTGKELMAQSIHNYSARSSFPFCCNQLQRHCLNLFWRVSCSAMKAVLFLPERRKPEKRGCSNRQTTERFS